MNLRTLLPTKLGGCPAAWKLSRALSEGDDFVLAHVRSCVACGAEWAALARTSAQAQALPAPAMNDESRERLAAQLVAATAALSSASRTRRPAALAWKRAAVFTLLTGGAAAAAGVAFHVVAGDRGQPGLVASLASIRAVGSASFSRVQGPPDELVRLDDGTLEFEVAPSSGGRRFRIATDDAEIDAPEGRFSVQADAHLLAAVRVFKGYVEVRVQGGGRAALHAGDEWTRSASVAMAAPRAALAPMPSAPTTALERSPSAARPARAAASARPSPRALLAPTPSEPPSLPTTAPAPQRASFERGWRLLRSGEPGPAAEAFREVDAYAKGDAIAEDALFWQSVALARANQTADARRSLAEFIRRFPSSARLGEASAMLGWMLVEAGETEGARRAFERAVHDRVDRVRASAQSGLERIAETAQPGAP